MSDNRDRFWYMEYARRIGAGINSDKEIVEIVTNGLDNNLAKFGVRYCPCRIEQRPNSVCPCLEFRETKHCHCGLFIWE